MQAGGHPHPQADKEAAQARPPATRTAAQRGALCRHRWIICPLCRADSGQNEGNQGAKTGLIQNRNGKVVQTLL